MATSRSSLTCYRLLVFLATAWTIASWIFLLDNNLFSQREKFQESDFIMTFYVAGSLAANGRSDELYPSPDARSFIDSPFNKAAHEILPYLPTSTTGAYMYIPLVAGFFAPFSLLDPNLSLFIWQAISVLALVLSTLMLARVSGMKASETFFLSFLFGPVFLTLWAGQLGLGFGLLPLCLGYFVLLRERQFLAGIIWSLLLLKPQYFLAAAFVTLVCAASGRFRTAIGMSVGVVGLFALTVVVFSFPITLQWLLSHRVGDAYFFAGLQGIPSHLVTGLPANIMLLFPAYEREAIKLPLYAAAATAWSLGLWFCWRTRNLQINESTQISVAFAIGLVLTSLTLPHLLYYDLCVLLPAGILLLAKNGRLPESARLRTIAVTGWIVVSGFLPFLLVFANRALPPLILELILLLLFLLLLWQLSRALNFTAHAISSSSTALPRR